GPLGSQGGVVTSLVAFWVLAGTAVGAAALCITRRSPIASALWLVVTLFCLAAIYVTLDAHFIAIMQVLVYAGAIVVLLLFVIVLLNLGRGGASDMKGLLGWGVGGLLFVLLALPLGPLSTPQPPADTIPPSAARAALKPQ